ncbi:MAG: hypothetical protein IPM43_04130 [Actinomycetota bacterium]|nr:MAG: hypothetical protein IPM43_04130 [Actinomycetota bacterium]
MHPIERLRYVARSTGADQRVLVRETAGALAGLRIDPAGLVTACRRIVERHPSSGPLWWLCSHLLTAPEPFEQMWTLAEEIDCDPTPTGLVRDLPEEATVCVVGWPDLIGEALVRRGDLAVLAVDSGGYGRGFANQLRRADVDVEEVPAEGAGAAAVQADLVLVEAFAAGGGEALCSIGARGVAAAAYCAEVPVWLVAGRARRLPDPTWAALGERLGHCGEPWELEVERVPLALMSHVCGAAGVHDLNAATVEALMRPECPFAPELVKASPT